MGPLLSVFVPTQPSRTSAQLSRYFALSPRNKVTALSLALRNFISIPCVGALYANRSREFPGFDGSLCGVGEGGGG